MNRILLRVFATVWTVCIVVASLQPFRPVATKEPHSFNHQIEHVLVFGATGLIYLALARQRKEDWYAVGGVFVLAMVIEITQVLMYHGPNGFEWWDVRDDMIGALLALFAVRYFQSAVKTLNS